MKRWLFLVAGLMLAFAVQASDSVRFGSRVITVGDSESKVAEIAGEPVRRVQLENKFGGAVGYRLDYEQGRKTVQIYISQGRVEAIAELY
ncbi:DUF2845 domain-containing protein [Rhodanobacter thiooxydans]|uniref:DUF2845 domain-containing protein n=1 Tax=Rhodanobacter thiooxydans TaxID=416169 RepID=UPI000308FC0F|nr:DUF2845 domain-containing protein [Rhodanobacter thiooxydans]